MSDSTQSTVPVPQSSADEEHQPTNQEVVELDLLVEEVSIDGMCGVY